MADGTTAPASQNTEQGQSGSSVETVQSQNQGTGQGEGNQGTTPSSLLGGEGAGTKVETPSASWMDGLPEDMRSSELLKAYKDPSELAKAHIEGAAKIAELEGKIPKVPDNADGYTLDIPKDVQVDNDFVAAMKDAAHKAGMSNEQLASMSNKYIEMQKALMAKIDQTIAESNKAQEDALKIEWGSKYDTELAEAQRAFKDPRLVASHEREYVDSRYGNDAMLVRIFNRLAKMVVEDAPPPDGGGAGGDTDKSKSGKPMLSFPSMQKK